MKASTLGVICGVASLAAVAGLYFKVEELSGKLDRRRGPMARSSKETNSNDEWIRVDRSGGHTTAHLSNTSTSDPGAQAKSNVRIGDLAPVSKEDLLARIRRLEARDKQRKSAVPFRWGNAKMARTVDDLATQLNLTSSQKDRIHDIVERGKQRIEDVMRIPDETGTSPLEQQKERHKKLHAAIAGAKDNPGGVISLAANLRSYRGKKIPGRNVTYGQEIDRIQSESKKEMRGSLSDSQQKDFDQTNVAPLLGGGGNTAVAIGYVAELPMVGD